MNNPVIIQGGMGVWVSNWELAKSVSQKGQLGVVSGTAIETVVIRLLQMGDVGGHFRRALKKFPVPEIANRMIETYFIEDGKDDLQPFKLAPMYSDRPSKELQQLTVASAFSAIYLAKENHNGSIGMNLLEKITLPNLATLYGAILAGVDYVLMGAGIPKDIPSALTNLSNHRSASLKLHVKNQTRDHHIHFDPKDIFPSLQMKLTRPKFIPIVSSVTLAMSLLRSSKNEIHGFVIEGSNAGGHNAPPRGPLQLTDAGEPVYGPKDEVDLVKFKSLGVPFWLAGSYGHPHQLQDALKAGAEGIQVGTPFAFCKEAGFAPEIKQNVLQKIKHNQIHIHTDPLASPSGFPFKVITLEGSVSDEAIVEKRKRRCDIGCLRSFYEKEDGSLGLRCPAEPVDIYLKKGGALEDTIGRKCVCNGLLSAASLPQVQKNKEVEAPIVTAGEDIKSLSHFLGKDHYSYGASDVISYILS